MRLLAFDFGMKYIGVAVGEMVTGSSRPLCSIKATDGIPQKFEMDKLINEWLPSNIIVGVPINLDGTKNHITYAAIKFANRLADSYKTPVFRVDESFSTKEAKALLKTNTKVHKDLQDLNAYCAKIILDRWIEQDKG